MTLPQHLKSKEKGRIEPSKTRYCIASHTSENLGADLQRLHVRCMHLLGSEIQRPQPAGVDDYVDMARAGPDAHDSQHIHDKAVFDGTNEVRKGGKLAMQKLLCARADLSSHCTNEIGCKI